ncbi:MAG: XrtA system polysaccharide chain length determinant [Alphaproteobacteria bacterium]
MYDVYIQVLSYLLSIWRRRWYVIGIAWAVCTAGWFVVAHLPDRYEASARIYVDAETMLGPLMRGMTVETNLPQQIDIMQRTLFSRPNIEKVILMTDLDLHIESPAAKEELITKMRQSLKVGQQGRNLFQITYEDSDPELAKRVVQAMLSIFVEGNLGASRTDMDTTRRFLQEQIAAYERQLMEQEQRVAEFKRRNMDYLPGSGSYHTQMQKVREDLAQTQSALRQAISLRDTLNSQLTSTPKTVEVPDIASGFSGPLGPQSDIHLRIFELEKTVDALLTRYTDKHPDVVTARNRLADLRKQAEEESKAQTSSGPGRGGPDGRYTAPVPRASNPVYEQLKLRLVQQETQIAQLQEREAEQKQAVEKWLGMAQTVPQVETELARLQRDYEIVKVNYDQLRQRQESARLARDLETKANKVQFRIVDPPQVPLTPSAPNRPLLLSAVLIVGVLSGTAIAFILAQINATYFNLASLRRGLSWPVLGAVSAMSSATERRRRLREALSFGVVGLGLFAAYGGLLTVEIMGII